MDTFFIEHGLPALFLLSFLAATLIPLGSEWLLFTLILQGISPIQVVAVATFGNVLGAVTTYAIGIWGSDFFMQKILRVDKKQAAKAVLMYKRYGTFSLLFAWLPIVGDPFCLAAGILRVPLVEFLLLVSLGKFARYAFIALLMN